MKILTSAFFVLLFTLQLSAQKIFSVDYQSQAEGNDGEWFFVKYSSQADKKIYFVDYESQADLKIFFVKYQSQTGWKKKEKKQLMY